MNVRSMMQPVGIRSPAVSSCAPCVKLIAARRRQLALRAASDRALQAPMSADAQDLEDGRKFRRVVFNFDKWTKLRSTSRYVDNMLSIPQSRIVSSLSKPVLAVTAFSVAICLYQTALEAHQLPAWAPCFLLKSPKPQVLTSFALSLLLVFRTSSSYARFDEARKIWGGILNHCRNITQMTVSNLASEERSTQALARWTMAFCYSLGGVVQEDMDLRKEASKFLEAAELELLLSSQNKPLKCLSVMTEVVTQTPMSPWQRQMFQHEVTFFHDAMGGCERLLKTPIPLSYTRHTSRFLIVWLTALPLALWTNCQWSMVPIVATVALLLLGIEEIGVQIEEPFGLLPLNAICERVTIDIKDLLQSSGTITNFAADLRGASPQTDQVSDLAADVRGAPPQTDHAPANLNRRISYGTISFR